MSWVPLLSTVIGIVGGVSVAEGEWPQVVALGDACTGTLVAPDVVVYAAHCGTDFHEATLGRTRDSVTAPIVSCRAHPDAALGGRDIAFCRLGEPLAVTPIGVLDPCDAPDILDAPVTIVGYGLDEHGRSDVKRAASTELVCATPDGEWLIGGDGRDACVGDSGDRKSVV